MKKRYGWILGMIVVYLLLVLLLSIVEARQPVSETCNQSDVTIHTFSDALWYSLITISTVGYGDMTPVTFGGRLIGIVFVFCSAGVLAAIIGFGLRLIGGALIPRMRLRFGRKQNWYVFSDCSADSYTLAEALYRDRPDCMLIFPPGGPCSFETDNVIRISIDSAALIRLRKDHHGICFFAMAKDTLRNYALSLDAAEHGISSYCMGDICPETVPQQLQLFSFTEAMSRHYWNTHPLLSAERCVVLIGCGKAGIALLERALLNNVYITERGIEYHVFGESASFCDLHPEIVRALDGTLPGSDLLIFHSECWTSARELLQRADRILLCADDDSENLAACDVLNSWYVKRAAVHLRLNLPLRGFVCFGEKVSFLTPENVMKEDLNRRAMLMNDIYNAGSPTPVTWHELSPFLRQSNIAAADHLLVKGRYLLQDETLTTLTREDCARAYARYRNIYPEQAELLLEMEHRRWIRFYQMYNWRYAPERNNDLRFHPLLLPFAQLSKTDQLKDAYAWEMFGRLAEM